LTLSQPTGNWDLTYFRSYFAFDVFFLSFREDIKRSCLCHCRGLHPN